MKRLALLIGLSAATMFVGCGVAPENVDDKATGEAEQAASSTPVRASSAGEYLIVTRPDYRKCAYPMCGGWFVRRVNHLLTRCTDGAFRSECHATELDLSAVGLTDDVAAEFRDSFGASHALVRARLRRVPDAYGNQVDTLLAAEAWMGAAASHATGEVYGVTDSGIICLTFPCPSFHEERLNTSFERNIHGVDLAASGASPESVQAGFDELFASGILVAGEHHPISGPGGHGRELTASEFYTRLRPSAEGAACGGFLGLPCPDGQFCDVSVPGACNGADLPGVCSVQPEACIDLYKPVCGCDGKTYGNDCVRRAAGAQLDHEGACGEPCGTAVCGEGAYCCNASCSICAPEGGACIQIVCQ